MQSNQTGEQSAGTGKAALLGSVEEQLLLKAFVSNMVSLYCIDLTKDAFIYLKNIDQPQTDISKLTIPPEILQEAEAFAPELLQQRNETMEAALKLAACVIDRTRRLECMKRFSVQGLKDAYEKGSLHLMQELQVRRDGRIIWVVIQAELFPHPYTGNLLAFLYIRDISAQKKSERIMNVLMKRGCDYVGVLEVRRRTMTFQFVSDMILMAAPHWAGKQEIRFDEDMFKPLQELLPEADREKMARSTSMEGILEELRDNDMFTTTFMLCVPGKKPMRKQLQHYWVDEAHEEILVVQSDITVAYEKELINEKLRREASTDPLTGMLNRRGLRGELDAIAHEARSKGRSFVLAMGDIDYFKRINDTYGHDAGDEVLKKIAAMMTAMMRGKGVTARVGGEEFVLAFHTSAVAQVYEWVDTLRMAIENTEITDGEHEFHVTMTFGIAVVGPFDEIHDAMEEADSRLYYGKNHGRNQVVT